MLSPYAKNEWLTVLAIGAAVTLTCFIVGWWLVGLAAALFALAVALFFRDPERRTPTPRNVIVAPSDGRISSVHELEHFEPFNGPATCIRVYMSLLNVHVCRCPCHATAKQITEQPGQHINALSPRSPEANASSLIEMVHPVKEHPVAAVRLIAGMFARTIDVRVEEGEVLQRGQRIGMIKLGSSAEIYLPADLKPQIRVCKGQKVEAGVTIVAAITPKETTGEMPIATLEAAKSTEPETAETE